MEILSLEDIQQYTRVVGDRDIFDDGWAKPLITTTEDKDHQE